jgi:hypothetical protein
MNQENKQRGLRHGYSLNPHSFNILIDDILYYISKGKIHVPLIRRVNSRIAFLDDLTSFTVYGLQNQETKFQNSVETEI